MQAAFCVVLKPQITHLFPIQFQVEGNNYLKRQIISESLYTLLVSLKVIFWEEKGFSVFSLKKWFTVSIKKVRPLLNYVWKYGVWQNLYTNDNKPLFLKQWYDLWNFFLLGVSLPSWWNLMYLESASLMSFTSCEYTFSINFNSECSIAHLWICEELTFSSLRTVSSICSNTDFVRSSWSLILSSAMTFEFWNKSCQ